MIPKFKKKEVIVEKVDNTSKLGGGDIKETVAIIKYVGDKVENYKVGAKILFDLSVANREIKYFGIPLLRIENEDFVTCEIVEEDE